MKNYTKTMIKNSIQNVMDYDKSLSNNDLFKEIFETILELERDQFLKYPKGSRNLKETKNKRNGYYQRVIKNLSGSFSVQVPRDRHGEFIPLTMDVLRKSEEELKLLGYKLYSKGMTTRDISDVFKEVFQTDYSAQSISNITKGFEHHRIQWQNRLLDSDYYFIYVDAIHTKIRRTSVASEAMYVVVGLKTNLERDVLGIYSIPQESASGWQSVFEDIRKRGVQRILMCVADGISNLEDSLNKVYPKAMLQKCVVHKIRSIIVKVRATDKKHMASDLRHIFDLDNPNLTFEEGKKRVDEFITKWEKQYPFIKHKFDSSILHHYFEYLKFPMIIRRLIYTTNWIERLNKHLRKVERNRNSFPNEDSAINLFYMAVIEFEEKVYKYKVSTFMSSKEHLDIMMQTVYPSLDT